MDFTEISWDTFEHIQPSFITINCQILIIPLFQWISDGKTSKITKNYISMAKLLLCDFRGNFLENHTSAFFSSDFFPQSIFSSPMNSSSSNQQKNSSPSVKKVTNGCRVHYTNPHLPHAEYVFQKEMKNISPFLTSPGH